MHPLLIEERGFTLIEALVSVAILTMISLSLAQLLGFGLLTRQSSEETTTATTLAAGMLETIRSAEWDSSVPGGDLASDSAGYFDSPDVDSDGNADYTRRWKITDQTGGRLVEVRVVANMDTNGPAREALVATVMAQR